MRGVGPGIGFRRRTSGGAGPPPFSPLDLSPLVWLDASDATTLFEDTGGTDAAEPGDTIALWQDKSGNGNHLSQVTAARRPTWDGSKVVLDGTDDRVVRSTLVAGALAQPYTIVVVGTIAPDSAVLVANGSGSSVTLQRATGATAYRGTAGALLNGTAPIALTTRTALTFEVNGATSRLFQNAAQVGSTGNGGANALNGLTVGCSSAGASFVNGEACEVLVFGATLTDGQRDSLQAYLAAKWSL